MSEQLRNKAESFKSGTEHIEFHTSESEQLRNEAESFKSGAEHIEFHTSEGGFRTGDSCNLIALREFILRSDSGIGGGDEYEYMFGDMVLKTPNPIDSDTFVHSTKSFFKL